jgi:hypothetical protein
VQTHVSRARTDKGIRPRPLEQRLPRNLQTKCVLDRSPNAKEGTEPDGWTTTTCSRPSSSASRCVCRAWRATIDARRMLRGDLLPISLGGIFVSLSHEPAPPEFFARPSAGPRIAARLQDYAEASDWPHFIDQCCNGLLLLEGCVVNPATRRCVRLPPLPS